MLVCARATEPVTTRGSTFDRHCGQCGARVMISPSGQRVLKSKKPRIICLQCVAAYRGPHIDVWAAASPEELEREKRDAIPNVHRERN